MQQCFFLLFGKVKKLELNFFRRPSGGDFSTVFRCFFKTTFFMSARRRRENFNVFQLIYWIPLFSSELEKFM